MSFANNSLKSVESNENKNNNFSEEKNNELNAEKIANDCNFWELITDVAKDLDLALQDLSPDFEISNNISNGIIGENAGNDFLGSKESSDPFLFESTSIRTTRNNSQQNTVELESDIKPIDDNNISAEASLDKTSSLSQTDSCALLPTFTAHSSAVSSVFQKPSYSLQLLSVMDNIQITSESDKSKPKTVPLFNSDQSQELLKDMGTEPEKVSTNPSADHLSEEQPKDEHSSASLESIPADIGLLERLIRCHPIWFLPEIGRAGVVHLLQGKEPGCFIVRQSSKANTMALSVRLPEGRGPHIEHYLIEDGGSGKLHLEGSDNYFSAIPMLVCHYSNCCDELPVQLTLPKVLAQSNRQQLTSLALLGQDFWQSSLSKLTNSSEDKSDDISSYSPNSSNSRSNTCSTFKSETQSAPPPIPPKQEQTTVDPLIDVKKSSTVPISQVITPTLPKLAPKTKPKPRPDPPPVPPRSKFVTMNGSQNPNAPPIINDTKPLINTSNSVSSSTKSETTAPNTEITLINLNNNKSGRTSSTSSASNSSQTIENMPKDIEKCPTNAQKQVLCYRSSLHDKESDYEDIWGANTISKLDLKPILGGIPENSLNSNRSHRSTQTEATTLAKNGSVGQISIPFYIDPIDAIPNIKALSSKQYLRRSDTDINEMKPSNASSLYGYSMESLIDSIRCESSQMDTCLQTLCTYNPNLTNVQLQVGYSTFAKHKSKEVRESSWPLDNSWKWLDDNLSSLCNRPFRRGSLLSCQRSSLVESMKSDVTTVEDLLTIEAPELTVPKASQLTSNNLTNALKKSEEIKSELNERYDNLALYRNKPNVDKQEPKEVIYDTDTEFSEPWDSDWWEGLVKKVFPRNALIQFSPETEDNNFLISREQMVNNCSHNSSTLTSLSDSRITSTFDITEVSSIGEIRSISSVSENIESTASDRLTVLDTNDMGIGLNLSHYVFELWTEGNNTFAKAINHFIQCTEESNENNPIIVMRNIRQFMNGMKNYLVKHGEGELAQMVQTERAKLKPNEFLNIDAILESALHRLVIKPLKKFLYQLFIKEYTKNGSLKVLSQNIKEAQKKTPQELGVRSELLSLDSKTMDVIQKHLSRLQQSYSPLKKLEHLLSTISTICNSVRHQHKKKVSNDSNSQSKSGYASFGADDFLPVFMYVLIQCGVVSAEIEADYMFGLLQPSILSGEGGYYLTTLSSAIHVLKHMHQLSDNISDITVDSNDLINASKAIPPLEMNSSSSETSVVSASCGQHSPYTQIKLPTIADLKAYMKIMIPDEFTSNISVKTLPIRPNMTTKEVCKMIAHKFKITNAEDFGLFKVTNGEEIALNDNDWPQTIKSDAMAAGHECQFAYKRFDAKFIWPLSKVK